MNITAYSQTWMVTDEDLRAARADEKIWQAAWAGVQNWAEEAMRTIPPQDRWPAVRAIAAKYLP